jgi:hypothetical protein
MLLSLLLPIFIYIYLRQQYEMWDSGFIINKWSESIVLMFFKKEIDKKELRSKEIREHRDKLSKNGQGNIAYGYTAISNITSGTNNVRIGGKKVNKT